jgi:hypothetical protein
MDAVNKRGKTVNKLLLSLCIFLTGCTINIHRKPTEEFLPVGNTPELIKVEQTFSSISSQEDKLTIHKLFSGAAEYLSNCEELDSTGQFDPILGRVQSSYGWNREKYPALTDAVSDYLVSVGYREPKKLSSKSERDQFASIFRDLAEATKYE